MGAENRPGPLERKVLLVIQMPALAEDAPADEVPMYPEEVLQAGWNPDVQRLHLALQTANQAKGEPVAAPEPPWGERGEDA